MGGIVTSLFGGGARSEPEVVEYKTQPVRENEVEPASAAARDAEKRRLRARNNGMSATILTTPLGARGQGLLGHSFNNE